MMLRSLCCVFLLFASACSLVDGGEQAPSLLWSTREPARVPSGSVGTVDAERYYAVRGRAQQSAPRLLSAYSRETGTRVWAEPVLGPCQPPVVEGERIYCPANTALYAFDATDGTPLWEYAPDDALSLVEGTADAARVYAGTLRSALAVDAATGSLVWQRSFDGPWERIRMRSLTLAPTGDLLVAFEGEYVAGQIFSASVVVAVDPATGEERWRYVDGDETTDRGIGGLSFHDGLVLYSATTGQEAVAFDLATREVVWRAPFLPNSFSGVQPPKVQDGIAYYSDTVGGMFAVDANTGAELWRSDQEGGFFSHEVCGDIVYGDTPSGTFLSREDGALVGRALDRGEDDVAGQVAVADDVLYVSADSGVYAFDCRL